jgi:hypothetical protein
MSAKMKLKMLVNGAIVDGIAIKAGVVVLADEKEAAALVAAGRAALVGVPMRVIRPALFGTVIRDVGDTFECGEADALRYHELGVALVADPASVSAPLPTPRVYPERAPKKGPYDGQPPVKVKALRAFLAGVRGVGVGEVAEVPESCAVRVVADGAAEFVGARKLTERGVRFLENLAARHLLEPAQY